MEKKTSEKESRIDRADRLWVSFFKWRQERIRKSLMRPLYQEALRSLFFVVILLVDTLFPLQLYESLLIPYNSITAIVALVVLLYFEMRVYNVLWGNKGRWSLDKYITAAEEKQDKKSDL